MKKNLKNVLLVIFMIPTFALGGFVIYDKVLKKSDVKCRVESGVDNNIDELKKYFNGYDKLGIEIMLENIYLKYLPDKDTSYSVSSLSDNDISMSVWKYIYYTSGGWLSDNLSRTNGEIEEFLERLYGLKDYNVKNLQIDDKNIFGLTKNNNKYTISVTPTEYGMTGYHVNNIEYNSTEKIVSVYFEKYMEGMLTVKTGEGVAKFKVVKNNEYDTHFEFMMIDYK